MYNISQDSICNLDMVFLGKDSKFHVAQKKQPYSDGLAFVVKTPKQFDKIFSQKTHNYNYF